MSSSSLTVEERRARNTAYARRHREAQRAARNATAIRCQAYLGNNRPCKTPLQNRFIDGETVPFCPTCDRKARGVCIVCEGVLTGRPGHALYCALHRKLAKAESLAGYRKRHQARLRKKDRKRISDPAVRADRCEYKRLLRKVTPTKIAEQKRRSARKHADQIRAYQQAYREQRREAIRERERLRHRGQLPPRECLTCPTIVTGRTKKCAACKQRARIEAIALLNQRPGMAA